MTSSDDSHDRELLERYRQASLADPRAPSAAVRAAILDEARRVADSVVAVPASAEPALRRASRWKMTAWGTAAAALLAALVVAPRLWNEAPPTHVAAISSPTVPFNQAAKKTESADSAGEPRPVVPVMPVPPPKLESIAPRVLADAPTLRRTVPQPPPLHVPEQSVEVSQVAGTAPSVSPAPSAAPAPQQAQVSSLAHARSVSPAFAAVYDSTRFSNNAAAPLLSAAIASRDLAKTRQLLDQGAAVNAADASGRTPLMLAIGQSQIDMVKLLLDRGADPNEPDNQGLSPLQLARQVNSSDIAAMLIKAGAH